ncbi:sugar phosphate isomerase/epimerase family protein [Streptomyces sp. NPDC057644]|uniref:sugar phosphate isomerase/epimerase family protein n=1 Tax=Streptomyces sp. NPDC057644 TaxID=3346191 RepID=UPI0036B23F60
MNPRAFSTLGCPGADLDEVVRLARAGPCTGVELRCAYGQLVHPELDPAAADRLAETLHRAGLAVPVLASYVQVAADEPDVVERLARHIALAARLGAGQVRVFGGGTERAAGRRERAVRQLAEAAPIAEAAGVGIALETHDEFLTGAEVAGILEAVGSPAVGAVWDAVNPWRAGEAPERTAELLGPWLRHVQLKDVASPTDLRPVVPGRGVLPLGGVLAQLRRLGYAGWISLEWERAWYPEAAPLAEALPAFHRVLDAA